MSWRATATKGSAMLSSTPNWPSAAANLLARPISWAMKPSADIRNPVHGIYNVTTMGPRVRFIRVDFRNTDRTPGWVSDPMDGSKTMFGAAQLGWLLTAGPKGGGATFATDQLNILCFESWWLASYVDPPPVASYDKMWNYPYEQK